MSVRVAPEMHVRIAASQLSNKIKQAEGNQRTACNQRKQPAEIAVDENAAPDNQHAQSGRKQDVAGASDAGDGEGLCVIPALCARGDDERQPVRRNDRVQKSDDQASKQNADENDIGHLDYMSFASALFASAVPPTFPKRPQRSLGVETRRRARSRRAAHQTYRQSPRRKENPSRTRGTIRRPRRVAR